MEPADRRKSAGEQRSIVAKVRVYELAKEFGVESKAVMAELEKMGEFVRSASSTIEAPVVRRLKEQFSVGGKRGGLSGGPGAAVGDARPTPPPVRRDQGGRDQVPGDGRRGDRGPGDRGPRPGPGGGFPGSGGPGAGSGAAGAGGSQSGGPVPAAPSVTPSAAPARPAAPSEGGPG